MNDLIPVDLVIPAHLANRAQHPSGVSEALGSGLGSGAEFARISLKGSRFRIIDDGVEQTLTALSLDIIIVGANTGISKTWYEAAWSPDSEPSAPDCFSFDGITPNAQSKKPQNSDCASCPHNAWGSTTTKTGTKLKACPDQKRLAVLSADDPAGQAYLLQVSPSALKGLTAYYKGLQFRTIAVETVRTTISFDTTASFPKLVFKYGGFVSPEDQLTVDSILGSDKILVITGGEPIAKKTTTLKIAEPEPEPTPATPPPPAAQTTPAPEQVSTGFGTAVQTPPPATEAVAEAPATEEVTTGFGAAQAPVPLVKAAAEAAEPAAEPVAAPTTADNETDAVAQRIASLMGDLADDE